MTGADLFATVTMSTEGTLGLKACVRDDGGTFDTHACDAAEENVLMSLTGSAHGDYARLLRQPDWWRTILGQATVNAKLEVHDRPYSALVRPVPGAAHYETPIPGLFLCGASILGCGVLPCLMSGAVAGRACTRYLDEQATAHGAGGRFQQVGRRLQELLGR